MSISFDRIADRYDATRGLPDDITTAVAEGIVRAGDLGAGIRLLEIGVGTGRLALPILAAAPQLRYSGIDISQAMLARLRAKLRPGQRISLLRGDATRLPIADASLERVFESHVLHLVESLDATLGEIIRVLRPGGLLICGFHRSLDADALAELRQERWLAILDELGAGPRSRGRGPRREEIVGALRARLGEPETAQLAQWETQRTPREVLDELARRTWSSTWDIPEPLFAEALRRLSAWAEAAFHDLDRPLRTRTAFGLEIYRRP